MKNQRHSIEFYSLFLDSAIQQRPECAKKNPQGFVIKTGDSIIKAQLESLISELVFAIDECKLTDIKRKSLNNLKWKKIYQNVKKQYHGNSNKIKKFLEEVRTAYPEIWEKPNDEEARNSNVYFNVPRVIALAIVYLNYCGTLDTLNSMVDVSSKQRGSANYCFGYANEALELICSSSHKIILNDDNASMEVCLDDSEMLTIDTKFKSYTLLEKYINDMNSMIDFLCGFALAYIQENECKEFNLNMLTNPEVESENVVKFESSLKQFKRSVEIQIKKRGAEIYTLYRFNDILNHKIRELKKNDLSSLDCKEMYSKINDFFSH